MRHNIETTKLEQALRLFKHVVEKRNTMPILAYVQIEATESSIIIRGTDLERELVVTLPNSGSCFSPVCVKPDELLVAIQGTDRVELGRLPEHRLTVLSDNAKIQLDGISAEEFPACMTIKQPDGNIRDWTPFATALERVAFAVSDDETRYNIASVCFDKAGNIVATDGHRLSVEPTPFLLADRDILLPACALPFLQKAGKLISHVSTGVVDTRYRGHGFCFEGYGICFTVRAVDGQFPDYRQVIPQETATTSLPLDVNRNLMASIKSITAGVAPKDMRKAAIKVEMNGHVALSFCKDETPRTVELNTVQTGKDLTIGIAAKYLIDVLNAHDSNRVMVDFRGPLAPIMFPRESGGYTLVMPMRFE